jgi:hypothetical protein
MREEAERIRQEHIERQRLLEEEGIDDVTNLPLEVLYKKKIEDGLK